MKRLMVTPANDRYDGFGTETVMVLDQKTRSGNHWRLVEILDEHFNWQTMRYSSGMYPCIPVETYDEWVRDGFVG